jgi:hypothetical protein
VRERKRERKRERGRKREKEGERERERDVEYGKGMRGALAPASYLVLNKELRAWQVRICQPANLPTFIGILKAIILYQCSENLKMS